MTRQGGEASGASAPRAIAMNSRAQGRSSRRPRLVSTSASLCACARLSCQLHRWPGQGGGCGEALGTGSLMHHEQTVGGRCVRPGSREEGAASVCGRIHWYTMSKQ
jgi:hypothetical protein